MLAEVLRDNEVISLFLIEKPTKEDFKRLKYIEDAWQYLAARKNIGLYKDEEKKYFDSEKIKEKSRKQKEGNSSIDRGIFNKEKIKRIKKIIDLDELIEEEVEKRVREREEAKGDIQ